MIIKRLTALILTITALLTLTVAGCSKRDPDIDAAATDEPTETVFATDGSATDAPSTDALITDAPNTDVPVTDAPATAEATLVPTDTPKPAPHAVSMGTLDGPARNTMPLELYGLSAAECEAWFSDAVFVGDSLTIGWKNYNNLMLQQNPDFFGETRFLCEGSYGVGHALKPVSDDSLHPIYGGEQRPIWESINMMNAKKVFLLFGLNDLAIYGLDKTLKNYERVINNIFDANPNAEVFVISTMYMYKGSEREVLNNANIYKFNRMLSGMCNEMNIEFINIASHLIDEEGYVPDEYSSDFYVHQTYKAYAVWAEVLRSLAARHILNYDHIIFE